MNLKDFEGKIVKTIHAKYQFEDSKEDWPYDFKDPFIIEFTDGSFLRIEPMGYETDGLLVVNDDWANSYTWYGKMKNEKTSDSD